MIRTRWVKRDSEWIKNNPKQPTMYKEEYDDGVIEVLKASSSPTKKAVISVVGPNTREVRELINKTTTSTKDAGIYAIICLPNRSAYIGQSKNVSNRLRNHKMVIAQGHKNDSKVYIDIIRDWKEFGPECFQFIKIKEMPFSESGELLSAETELMIEYLENGYTLYNRDHCNNTYVSPSIRPMILNLMLAIKDKPELLNTIEALID